MIDYPYNKMGERGNSSEEEVTNNPLIRIFKNLFRTKESKRKDAERLNSLGQSELQANAPSMYAGAGMILNNFSDTIDDPVERRRRIAERTVQDFHQKLCLRVENYRKLAMQSEVSEVLDSTCNEAIIKNTDGQIISLNIRDNYPDIAIGKITKIKMQQDFNKLMQTVFNFDKTAWNYMRKFLIEGAIFWEVIYDKENKAIIGVKQLPSYNMLVIVDGDEVVGYRQVLDQRFDQHQRLNKTMLKNNQFNNNYIDYSVNQILYWSYDLFGKEGINDRFSYLETARKTINQLKNIEDAIVRYRILRGHEKRVYYIATGNLPPQMAEKEMQRQMNYFKRTMYYNTDDGTIMGLENVQGMSEDFFISVPQNGNSSKIDTLAAGANLGEITDLNYFKEKLYLALKYPKGRSKTMAGQTGPDQYNFGKANEISREEISFSRFIERVQDSFAYQVLIPLFVMYLETRQDYNDDLKDEKLYTVNFTQSNVFKLLKEAEIIAIRFQTLQSAAEYIDDGTDGPKSIFAKEYVTKYLFKMTDEEWQTNEKLKELARLEAFRKQEQMNKMNDDNMNLTVPENGGGMTDSFGGGGLPNPLGGESPDLGGDSTSVEPSAESPESGTMNPLPDTPSQTP